MMKLEYKRIDVLKVIDLTSSNLTEYNPERYQSNLDWLKSLSDVEYREDYQCFFVLKGSSSHTAIAMKLGDVFE